MIKGEIGLENERNEIKKNLVIRDSYIERDIHDNVYEVGAIVNDEAVKILLVNVGDYKKVVCLSEGKFRDDITFGKWDKKWQSFTFDLGLFANFKVQTLVKKTTTSPFNFDGGLFAKELTNFLDKKSKEAEEATDKDYNLGDNDKFIFAIFELKEYINHHIWQRGNYWACLNEVGDRLDYRDFAIDYGDEFGWFIKEEVMFYQAVLQKVFKTEEKEIDDDLLCRSSIWER